MNSRGGERGAVLVEGAIIAPILMLLVFSIFEFGLMIFNANTTSNASRSGARTASVYGTSPESDFFVLETIEREIESMGVDKINFVAIYKVDTAGDPIPPGCRVASVANLCNRYVATDFALPLDKPDTTPDVHFRCGPAALDRFWCPTSRNAALEDPPDLVGIYIETEHYYVSGFFGDSRALTEHTVIRIEPEKNT